MLTFGLPQGIRHCDGWTRRELLRVGDVDEHPVGRVVHWRLEDDVPVFPGSLDIGHQPIRGQGLVRC